MSTETPEAVNPNPEECQEDRRLENAGSTPLPTTEESPEKEGTNDTQTTSQSQPPVSTITEEDVAQPQPAPGISELSSTVLQSAPPTSGADPTYVFNNRNGDGLNQQPLPLSLNKLAIFASAQNKLPVSKVSIIVKS